MNVTAPPYVASFSTRGMMPELKTAWGGATASRTRYSSCRVRQPYNTQRRPAGGATGVAYQPAGRARRPAATPCLPELAGRFGVRRFFGEMR